MGKKRTAADVLLEAADLLDETGWCRGEWEDACGHLCTLGAIAGAAGDPHGRLYGEAVAIASDELHSRGISSPPMKHVVPWWNDKIARRRREVQRMLRAAAKRAQS